MFDFDAAKLLIIGMVALVVIGPKDLPRVLRQFGQMVGKVRRMAGEFQGQFMEAMKEADLQDLRAEVAKLNDTARIDVDFHPARDVQRELVTAVNGTGEPAVAAETAFATEALPSTSRASKSFPSMDVQTPSIAATGVAPVAELPPAMVVAATPLEPPDGTGAPPRRRKVVIAPRRPVSRFDVAQGGPALVRRSRNILPARRGSPHR